MNKEEIRQQSELETAELERQKVIRSKVMFFDSIATESENGTCFGCLENRALPNHAYCKKCMSEILTLTCICCGNRLYQFEDDTLMEDTPDGEFCYHCLHNLGRD
jgi:hypothetical protein